MNCASSKAEKRPSKKGRFPFRRNSSKLKVNPEHGTVSNEQKLEDQVGAGLQKSAEGAGSNMNDDAVPHNVLVFEEIGESTDCVDEKDVEELENAAKFSLGQDDGDEDQFVELDGLNKDIKASLNRDDSKTDKTDSDSLEPKKNEVKEDKDITHLDHTDELSLDNDGSKCHQTKYDNLVFPGIEVTSCDGEEERPKVLDEVPTVINKKDQPEEDAESLDDKLAFTKYVDKASVRKALEKHSDDIVEGHDIEVGEELIVQYLNKKDKKHLKMVLRPAAWSMSHEIRKVLWYNMCHYLHKADDGDIYTEYLADLFPNSDNTEELRLPSFVDPTHLYSFHLNLEGIKTVGKILYVVEHACPDIIYSPLLYPIVCLFLHFMDAPQCYGCVYALIRQSDSMFLPTTRTCYEASKLVIRDLAKKYAKGSYSHLVRSVGNIDNVFDSWLWWILEDIPITYLVHIVDCYLHEGIKVFYRVALAIITLHHKQYGKRSANKTDMVASIRQFCREMPVKIDKLLKVGFGVRGLNRREIWKLQMKHEMYVNSVKNVAETPSRANLPLSRSFSGPVILQNIPTTMLTPDMLYAVWTWLPTRYAVCQPELLFTTEEHGTSLVTLYQRVENYQPTIIVIKTTKNEIFGAFCSMKWSDRRQKSQLLSYFGTGETFIFTLFPEKKKYDWVGLTGEDIPNTANMFQAGDRSILTIGGGHGEAIFLDQNLLHCRSEKCDTFNNEPLSESEDFTCKVVEVYGLQ